MFFTGFFENVHPSAIVHAVSTALRGHLIATGQVKGIPGKQPVISVRGVCVVDVLLQLTLVQVRHLAVVGGCLRAVGRMLFVEVVKELKGFSYP